jgi:hypothetical protein
LNLKRISAVAVLMVAGLLLVSTPSSAAQANWEGTVSSNGATVVFETQRTASMQVKNTVTGTAEAGIALVNCTDFGTVSGEWHMPLNTQRKFGATAGRCFRQQIRRWTPKDTNGFLPGFGDTDLSGVIIW